MISWIQLLILAAAAVVLTRSVCQVSTLSHKKWTGHQLQFACLSLAHALVAGGAAGIALGWHAAPSLLLLGVAGWVLFDRRKGAP